MINLKKKDNLNRREKSERTALPAPRGPSPSELDWWPGLSDVDKVSILKAPLEDRARLLASNHSKSIEDTLEDVGDRVGIPVLDDFKIPENATRLLPLRIIHEYCCLPIEGSEDGKISIVTVWPPTNRMSRWVFAVSGK
ncbi:uncharacterized protein METZ01_LOCUS416733, partial [marine metagenome]